MKKQRLALMMKSYSKNTKFNRSKCSFQQHKKLKREVNQNQKL